VGGNWQIPHADFDGPSQLMKGNLVDVQYMKDFFPHFEEMPKPAPHHLPGKQGMNVIPLRRSTSAVPPLRKAA
jgi:hypothetical protein